MASLVRLAPRRFCEIAALGVVLCQTPKVVGVASIQVRPKESDVPPLAKHQAEDLAPVLPDSAQRVGQTSVRLQSGVLVASVGWAVDDMTSLDVLRGHMEYRPDADRGVLCTRIRFIQVAKTEGNGGLDLNWQGLERQRNVLRTSSEMGTEVKPGYFVDHRASSCVAGAACSPYFEFGRV
jgi:hypothetical protein